MDFGCSTLSHVHTSFVLLCEMRCTVCARLRMVYIKKRIVCWKEMLPSCSSLMWYALERGVCSGWDETNRFEYRLKVQVAVPSINTTLPRILPTQRHFNMRALQWDSYTKPSEMTQVTRNVWNYHAFPARYMVCISANSNILFVPSANSGRYCRYTVYCSIRLLENSRQY